MAGFQHDSLLSNFQNKVRKSSVPYMGMALHVILCAHPS